VVARALLLLLLKLQDAPALLEALDNHLGICVRPGWASSPTPLVAPHKPNFSSSPSSQAPVPFFGGTKIAWRSTSHYHISTAWCSKIHSHLPLKTLTAPARPGWPSHLVCPHRKMASPSRMSSRPTTMMNGRLPPLGDVPDRRRRAAAMGV
jgi:hypothetical protein